MNHYLTLKETTNDALLDADFFDFFFCIFPLSRGFQRQTGNLTTCPGDLFVHIPPPIFLLPSVRNLRGTCLR